MSFRWFWGFIFSFLLATGTWAHQNPLRQVKVVPWMGHKAAISLTFDDGDPSQLDVAIPELNQRHLKASFYLIVNRLDRKDEWRQILKQGHEIGNHTLDHKHANELTPSEEEAQVVGAQNVLQKEFGVPVLTFAYPFIEISPGLRKWVEKRHLLARGGPGANDILTPDSQPDWMNIPARITKTELSFDTYKSWIDEDLNKDGWLVFMIHSLEGTTAGWEPISKKIFTQTLDYIQGKDIWVGTFLEVGSYFRAQKVFEEALGKAKPVETKSGVYSLNLNWEVPEHFPRGVLLKIHIENMNSNFNHLIEQGKGQLQPDQEGNYLIGFDAKHLNITFNTSAE